MKKIGKKEMKTVVGGTTEALMSEFHGCVDNAVYGGEPNPLNPFDRRPVPRFYMIKDECQPELADKLIAREIGLPHWIK